MKRRILKILAPLALIAVLLFSAIFASGCYIVKGVKMKDLKGTYEMTRYSTDIDRMTEKEIKMYMIINSDGKGYYVYQDKDTAVYAAEMRCRFTNNQEDTSKYDYVECEFTGNNGGSSDSWYKFGVNSKNLNYHRIVWKPLEWGKPLEKDYDINVSFNKVSSKTDLSFVEDKLGVELTAAPYGLARRQALYKLNGVSVSGWYLTRGEVAERGLEEPIYAYIRLDVMNSKATIYYMMASDEVQKEIEFIYDITDNGDGTFYLTDKKGGRWSLDYSGLHYLASVEGEAGMEAWSWDFGWTNIFEYDLTEEIATNVSAYESDKCSFKGHEWTQDEADLCEYKKICAVCGVEEGVDVEHQYDNDDDAICNVCGKERGLPIVPPEVLPPEGSEETEEVKGEICPDFTVQYIALENGVFTSSDKTFTLSENRGKITVINIWETWCPPCINEIPEFAEFKKAYPEVDIIAITEQGDDVIPWMNSKGYHQLTPNADWTEYSIDFATYNSAVEDVYVKLGGSGAIPLTVIVADNGVIVYQQEGALTYERLEALITPYL